LSNVGTKDDFHDFYAQAATVAVGKEEEEEEEEDQQQLEEEDDGEAWKMADISEGKSLEELQREEATARINVKKNMRNAESLTEEMKNEVCSVCSIFV
jgi:hypothetical protein